MKFATQFSPRKHIALKFTKPSLTKQAPANEVDINKIMERYLKATGMSPDQILEAYEALYYKQSFGDSTVVPDFDVAQNMLAQATGLFESLPSKVRERFGNSTSAFLKFMADDSNMEEAAKLGLVTLKEKTAVEVSTPMADSAPVTTQAGEAPTSA